jgi:hypothetical protein
MITNWVEDCKPENRSCALRHIGSDAGITKEETWVTAAGSRRQEAGSKKQEARSRKQEARSRSEGPLWGSKRQEAGGKKPEARSKKPEASLRLVEASPKDPFGETRSGPRNPKAVEGCTQPLRGVRS